jgi:chromate reductase
VLIGPRLRRGEGECHRERGSASACGAQYTLSRSDPATLATPRDYLAFALDSHYLPRTNCMRTIAVVVGSISRDSINRRVARALEALGRDRFAFIDVRIDDFPLFSVDLAKDPPASVIRIKKEIADADGVIIVTPEHNRSIPAALKNAIDWGSRPAGQSCWIGKPAAIMGASTGQTGTAAAQQHLRTILSPQQVIIMGQPEMYIHWKSGLLDDAGNVADETARKRMELFLERFAAWVERVGARSA